MPEPTVPPQAADGALTELERWLADGSLAQAIQLRDFGASLTLASTAMRDAEPHVERLERFAESLDMIAAYLTPEDRRESERDLANFLGHATRLARVADRPGLEALARTLPRLESAADGLFRRCQAAWTRSVQRDFAPTERLGLVLQRLPGLADLGRRLADAARRGLALGERFPPGAEERRRREELLAACRAERMRLEDSGATAGAVAFLLQVAEERVTLADIQDDVRDWLRRQNALGLFRVTLG